MPSDYERADTILVVVARLSGITLKRLRSCSRIPTVTKMRDTALYLIRKHTALSFPDIGQLVGRHHSSVISSCRREELRLQRNPPRTDRLSWAAWHAKVLDGVRLLENATPVDVQALDTAICVDGDPVQASEFETPEFETPEMEPSEE